MRRFNGIILLGLAVLVIGFFVPVDRLHRTCVVCRLSRVDSTCLSRTRSSFSENECSTWYASHVEPKHGHIWERSTCRYRSNLLGMPIRVGCRPGHYPIMLLDPAIQMRAYQHFKDPKEAKRLFVSLTDANSFRDRLDEWDEDRGHLMVRALQAWDVEGYPGTWTQWWERYHAEHVAEHQEWLIWFNDENSHVNFLDWQRQRHREREGPSGR